MHRGPWQVQIIDDEIVILLAVSRAYRDKPIDIITATNADQALAQMNTFNFDLFLLDLDMKARCSFNLLKVISERFPDIPVILMTTGDTGSGKLLQQITDVRTQGCWHLLEKPFDLKKLTGFIERGLQESSSVREGNQLCEVADQHEQRRCKRFSRFERLNLSLPTAMDDSRQTVPLLATLTDISVGGLGLTTRKTLVERQRVQFDEKFMHQSGIVVWSQMQEDKTCRAGICFT